MNSIPQPDLPASLLDADPQVRLLAVGEVLWQAQAFVRSVALAQAEARKLLPEDLSDEAKKSLAAVQRVAENTVCWLDDYCKRIYSQTNIKSASEDRAPLH
jgi:hypothetical protein